VETGAHATAAVMAAVSGELGEAPGVLTLSAGAAIGTLAGLAYAAAVRAPLLLISHRTTAVAPAFHLPMVRPTSESAGAGVAKALRLALDDPRGPVHLVLPSPGAAAETTGTPEAAVGPGAVQVPTPATLDEAARVLGAARRPVLVIGLRCRAAVRWLRALTEAVPMPALATLRGKGILPDPHPLMLGQLDGGGALLARADLIVTAGLDSCEDMSVTWPALPRLDLGAAPEHVAGGTGVVRVGGDVALIIEELAPRLRDRPRADWDVAELDRLKRARRAATPSDTLSPARTVEVVRALTPAGTIATADEGPAAAVIAAAWQTVGPSELLIGVGDPEQPFAPAAAVAASLARPGRCAVAFTDPAALAAAGDALATARRLDVPVALIGLGEGTGEAPPGVVARSEAELARALHQARTGRGPFVIYARARRERESSV
jgi:acetolactate synthase-1/2/3 large subunit